MEITSPWTEELCQYLRENWGTSSRAAIANMIGEKFGIQVSRNAVIGKGIRLGLEKRTTTRLPAGSNVVARKVAERTRPVGKKTTIRVDTLISAEQFKPRVVDTNPRHLTILQLTDETCKYECSSASAPADFTFCGHRTLPDMPYCAAHSRICYLGANYRRAQA